MGSFDAESSAKPAEPAPGPLPSGETGPSGTAFRAAGRPAGGEPAATTVITAEQGLSLRAGHYAFIRNREQDRVSLRV